MRGAEKGGTGPDLLSLMLAAGIAQNVCFAQPVEAFVKSFAKRLILYIYIATEWLGDWRIFSCANNRG
jgi:hypothetical protein